MAATNFMPSAPPAAGFQTNGLRDIKPPIDIPSGWEWAWWLLGVVVLAILAWWLWRYLQQRQAARPLPPPIPPHVRARRRLEEALRLLSEPKPFVIAVSDALRAYLEERFSFRAPERTTEEFLHELQSTDLLDASQKERLSDFLQRCDLVKFARHEPTEMELRDLHASALGLVNETEPRDIGPAPAAT
jgi:hypothetical protein